MIVIASHDNVELLESMLQRLTEVNLNGHEVLIVDTNSQSNQYLSAFLELKQKYSQFLFDRKDYTCWDSGAYIHAYKNYVAEKYIFLQDSLYITDPDLFIKMDQRLDEYDVATIFHFHFDLHLHTEEESKWTFQGLYDTQITGLPTHGIFGPFFGVTKRTLDKIPKEWFIEPVNKTQGCLMERRWALMFHQIGASKKSFYGDNDVFAYEQFDDKYVKKVWMHRLQ